MWPSWQLSAGGMEDIVHNTLRKYTIGYQGCISSATLATDYRLQLIDDADDGSNISRCPWS